MSQNSFPPGTDGTGAGPRDRGVGRLEHVREETESFLAGVETVLATWLDRERETARGIGGPSVPLVECLARLSAGGKRTRAQLLYWGWRAAGGAPESPVPRTAAAGFELFQTAALIHDDIIDRSATRRGMPSVHEAFRALHAQSGWAHDGAHFGVSAAVLIGDLALSWSEQLMQRALDGAGHPPGAAEDFATMRTEVMHGQYLDVHAEVAAGTVPPEEAVERALEVVRYKSAKYSAEHPVALGALLAAAPPPLVAGCRSFALPLGEAFQIRDDILGVFGDPETTGKPAGDDLREGKRTVLIGLHLESAGAQDAAAVQAALGDPSLSERDVDRLRDALRRSGALTRAEHMVEERAERVDRALDRLDLDPTVELALRELSAALMRRAR